MPEENWDTLYSKYGGRAPNPSSRYEEMRFIEKIKKVILSPSEFFERIKGEEGVGKAFIYLAILSLIDLVVGIITITLNIHLFSFLPFLGKFATLIGIMIPIAIYILKLVGSFTGAGFIHLFMRLFGGKGNYSMTYKAVVYASTPSLLLGWIPYVGVISAIYTFYLSLKGLSKLHSVSMKRVFVAVFGIPLIILLITIIILAGLRLLSSSVLRI